MSWAKFRKHRIETPTRDTNPAYFSGGLGEEKFPLTDEERAAIRANRKGGHSKFQRHSRWTGKPVRAFDETIGIIWPCQRCHEPFYDDTGEQICDRCK